MNGITFNGLACSPATIHLLSNAETRSISSENRTGTEDYFCGSYNFENKKERRYQEYSTAYAGVPQVVRPDGLYSANTRFSMYRWHIADPIRFKEDLKVTIQALGWREGGRYLPLKDDIASVAYWYQTPPAKKFPPLPSPDELEII